MFSYNNKYTFLKTGLLALVLSLGACGGDDNNHASSSSVSSSAASSSSITSSSSAISNSSSSDSNSSADAASDTSPDEFSFTPQRDVELNSIVISNAVTVTGINVATPISVLNGEYAINDGAFTSSAGTIQNNDSVRVRLSTGSTKKFASSAVLTIGDMEAAFATVNEGPSLGFNLNGAIENYTGPTKTTIDQLNSRWARGFLDYFFFFDKDNDYPNRLNNSPKLSNIAELKAQGYQTIISIKWDFKNPARNMPPPGPLMDTYKARLVELYDKIWDNVDVIVVGNEPFIESPGAVPSTAFHLRNFYDEMLKTTIEYRAASSRPNTPIYLGAFNRLADSAFQNAANDLLQLARDTPEVTGVDLHIHHLDAGFDEMKTSVNYAKDRLRADQKFISTEFSPMRYWKTHNDDNINADFAQQYGVVPEWKVHEYLNDRLAKQAAGNGVTHAEWLDFVGSHPWYENLQNGYLTQAFNTFMETAPDQFELATYGVWQQFGNNATFDVGTDPWILNGIIVNRTVAPKADGTFELNKYYHLDFDRLR